MTRLKILAVAGLAEDLRGPALTAALGRGRHVVLTADAGPQRRYRAFLAVARGAVQVVVGTRAAAFAPSSRTRLPWSDASWPPS